MVYNARQSQDAFINSKGETLMKSVLIRILAIATLATSMSAFAAADEPKPNDDAATTSATKQHDGCVERAAHGKKEKKAKPQSDDQNDKDFDRVLMAIYG
jgi:hypothetical protein